VNTNQRFSTQDKEFRAKFDIEAYFSITSISYTKFMIYKLSMVHEVPLQQKEA
jgi:hypothetical protein